MSSLDHNHRLSVSKERHDAHVIQTTQKDQKRISQTEPPPQSWALEHPSCSVSPGSGHPPQNEWSGGTGQQGPSSQTHFLPG